MTVAEFYPTQGIGSQGEPNMNYGKLIDSLADEERKLQGRIKIEEDREESLAAYAREVEAQGETPETTALMDRVSDLVNRQIKKADALKWRGREIKTARHKLEEIQELQDTRRQELARGRRLRAQKAV